MTEEPQPNEQVPIPVAPVEAVTEKKEKKKSFVDDKDAPPVAGAPKGQTVVPCEVSLMLIYNQVKNEVVLLTEIRDLLRNGISQTTKSVETPISAPTPAPAPVPVQVPAQTSAPVQAPVSQRLQEILTAIEPIKDLVFIDENANDNMFYIIRPRQFLGSENFSKVGSVMRSIGAQYQSAGKNSHFKASKAGK